MKIETKYNIGYHFWVPQVSSNWERETVVYQGDEYSRQVEILDVAAYQYLVVGITVDVLKHEINTIYHCAEYDKPYLGPTKDFTEDSMMLQSYTEAINFARHWRDTEMCEYLG